MDHYSLQILEDIKAQCNEIAALGFPLSEVELLEENYIQELQFGDYESANDIFKDVRDLLKRYERTKRLESEEFTSIKKKIAEIQARMRRYHKEMSSLTTERQNDVLERKIGSSSRHVDRLKQDLMTSIHRLQEYYERRSAELSEAKKESEELHKRIQALAGSIDVGMFAGDEVERDYTKIYDDLLRRVEEQEEQINKLKASNVTVQSAINSPKIIVESRTTEREKTESSKDKERELRNMQDQIKALKKVILEQNNAVVKKHERDPQILEMGKEIKHLQRQNSKLLESMEGLKSGTDMYRNVVANVLNSEKMMESDLLYALRVLRDNNGEMLLGDFKEKLASYFEERRGTEGQKSSGEEVAGATEKEVLQVFYTLLGYEMAKLERTHTEQHIILLL